VALKIGRLLRSLALFVHRSGKEAPHKAQKPAAL
jgi:hypothetical protein